VVEPLVVGQDNAALINAKTIAALAREEPNSYRHPYGCNDMHISVAYSVHVIACEMAATINNVVVVQREQQQRQFYVMNPNVATVIGVIIPSSTNVSIGRPKSDPLFS
jgi:hypothetical protein